MGVAVAGNECGDSICNGDQIVDQQMPMSFFPNGQSGLCSDIINQYGQLIGEYSRLDDQLWFSNPEEDDVHESNFTPPYEYTVHPEQLSKSIDNPISDGGVTCVKETSSSLNDSSLDQSQTSSPISVLRRRSLCSMSKKATKHDHSESCPSIRCNSPDGLLSMGPKFPASEHSQYIQPESYTESSLLDETTEPSPAKRIRMKKISDLLLSGGPGLEESGSLEREQDPDPKLISERKKPKGEIKKCMHCESTKTPQWREGPKGQATLCNACGVQYREGRLFPDYRPLKSPTFNPSLHSNLESGSFEREQDPSPKPTPKMKKPKLAVKKCMHCLSAKTPQWREGPMGQATLCNACGVQYRKGRLFPEDLPLQSPTFDPSLHSNLEESGSRESEQDPNPKPVPKRKKPKMAVKKCMHCESTKTPQWREGPMGYATLCNACGVQYRHGRLFPEYRPLKSPTFNPSLHSHLPKKVQQMRMNAKISAVSSDSE